MSLSVELELFAAADIASRAIEAVSVHEVHPSLSQMILQLVHVCSELLYVK